MQAPTPKRYVVGIDPGVKTGVASFDSRLEALAELFTSDFWGVVDHVMRVYAPNDAVIVIENPKLNRPVFRERGHFDKPNVREEMAQRVGANKRDATLLIERFEALGFEVQQVRPSRRKWTAEDLLRETRWSGRSSQHARDAAALIYRR
jgi:hypothetical protein